MKQLLTKKSILITTLFGTVFFITLFFLGTDACYQNVLCKIFRNIFSYDGLSATALFPACLFLSLITYKLYEEVFVTWIKFAKWWVLGTLFLIFIAPAHDPSLLPITKEVISLIGTGLFVVISLLIIIYKSLNLRKN